MSDVASIVPRASARPLLSSPEEQCLSRLIHQGRRAQQRIDGGSVSESDMREVAAGRDARTVLVESNLRLVVSIARRFPTHTLVDMADMIQAGNQGLLLAAERFDPDRGFRFSTFATRYIRSGISRAIDKGTSALHMPIDVVNGLRSSLRTAGEHDGELPHHLVPLERAYLAVSLDLPLPDGVTRLGDLQPDPAENVEERVEQRMEAQALTRLLADLPTLHRQALQLRFGLIDDRPRSYAALAEGLAISTRQSRKLVAEGIEQVRLHAR